MTAWQLSPIPLEVVNRADRDDHLHEGNPECLDLSADPELGRLLKTQLSAAIALLRTQHSRAQTWKTFQNTYPFLRMLYTVVQHVTLIPLKPEILQDSSFLEMLCKIILDPQAYDMRRKSRVNPTEDSEHNFEVDYVSLVSLHHIFRIITNQYCDREPYTWPCICLRYSTEPSTYGANEGTTT